MPLRQGNVESTDRARPSGYWDTVSAFGAILPSPSDYSEIWKIVRQAANSVFQIEANRRHWNWNLGLILAVASATSVSSTDGKEPRTLVVFSAMGDIPYSAEEYLTLKEQIKDLPKESAFVVHVGDIKTGESPCTENAYESTAEILSEAKCPLFIIPGDNEWNDCKNPDDAWIMWMKHFKHFDERWKHGWTVNRQEKRNENFAFVRSEVLFIGINVVGGRVHDAEEWKRRHAEDLEWTRRNLDQHRDSIKSVVIFGHAFPLKVHDDYFHGLSETATEFKKPMLYLHGDGHRWIRNRPFAAQNILRIQVDQGRIGPPIKVTVTDDPKEPFVVDRRKADE